MQSPWHPLDDEAALTIVMLTNAANSAAPWLLRYFRYCFASLVGSASSRRNFSVVGAFSPFVTSFYWQEIQLILSEISLLYFFPLFLKQGLQKSEILNSSEQAIPSIPVALHTTQCSRPPNARLQADFASELQSHKSSCLLVSLPRNIFSHDPPFTWPVTGDHSSPCIWSPNSFSSTSAYFCTSTNTSTTDTPVQDTIFCHFPFSNPVAQYILLTAGHGL
ncbi:hypothetical protein JEQ12_000347 [Ovis aries]|uniref:Uncharacterized protein n=1 Tax=Ovis aries TaxID=9940 RepID=A0A836APJ8_SHEEP|nr:hypothetical protein JEQ12_000347 [Ovis aries]